MNLIPTTDEKEMMSGFKPGAVKRIKAPLLPICQNCKLKLAFQKR